MSESNVVPLHAIEGACSNIPEMLRLAADCIERGEYGDVQQCVCIMFGERLSTFLWGRCDPGDAMLLLKAAENYMVEDIVKLGA